MHTYIQKKEKKPIYIAAWLACFFFAWLTTQSNQPTARIYSILGAWLCQRELMDIALMVCCPAVGAHKGQRLGQLDWWRSGITPVVQRLLQTFWNSQHSYGRPLRFRNFLLSSSCGNVCKCLVSEGIWWAAEWTINIYRISAFIRMVESYQKLWPQKSFPFLPVSFHPLVLSFFPSPFFFFSFPLIPMALNMNVSTAQLSAIDMTSMGMCVIKSKELTKLCAGITLKADVVFRGDYFYCVFLLLRGRYPLLHHPLVKPPHHHQPTNHCPALLLWPFPIPRNRSSCYQLLACS